MSEFDKARLRYEAKASRKTDIQEAVATTEIKLPQQPKAPRKRSNEISVSVWIDGNVYSFTFKTNITGTMLGSQQNRQGMQHLLLDALRSKFGAVELV